MTLWERIVAGAIAGLLAALVVDLDAYKKSARLGEFTFDWGLAVQRWLIGALLGAASAVLGGGDA